MPGPRGGDDVFEARVARGPPEIVADFFRAGDEGGRIAGAAWRLDRGDVSSGHKGSSRDDFANAETETVAQIVDERARGRQSSSPAAALEKRLKHENVRDGKNRKCGRNRGRKCRRESGSPCRK